jgi:O-Antigen ligase
MIDANRRVRISVSSVIVACTLLYFAIGKVAFEPRLAAGAISLNQLLQVGILVGLIALPWTGDTARLARSRTLWMTGVLASLLALRAIGAQNTSYAPAKPLGYLGVVLPSFALLVAHLRSSTDVRRFLVLWAVVGTGMMLLGVVSLAVGDSPPRLAVFGGGGNVYARMLGTAMLIWVGLDPWRTHGRVSVWLLALPGIVVGLLFAGSKTVILALGIALSVLGWFRHERSLLFGSLAGLLLFAVVPRITHLNVPRAEKNRGEIRMFIPPDIDDPRGSYGTRLTYYGESLRLLARTGWFGVGTGEWPLAVGLPTGRRYPHNLELEIGCELGLSGLVWLLVLIGLVAPWFRGGRHPGSDPRLLGTLTSLLVFWLINAQLSGDLLDNRWVLLVVMLTECASMRTKSSLPHPIKHKSDSLKLGVEVPT